MISVGDFLKINRIDSLDSSKVLAIHSPRGGAIKADLLRGMVYCSKCNKTLTSMLIPKRDKETGEVIHARYYYKCETDGCLMHNKSIRAGVVVDAAQAFFKQYLFITHSNYDYYVKEAKKEVERKSAEFSSTIAGLKVTVANKEKSYEQTKDLILKNPELKEHYSLDNHNKEIEKLRRDYAKAVKSRDRIASAIPTFTEYLKLLESTPVILGKIRDMKAMDALLRIFFSNFTVTPGEKDFRKGSTVAFKLNEPWEGFVSANEFVSGAGCE